MNTFTARICNATLAGAVAASFAVSAAAATQRIEITAPRAVAAQAVTSLKDGPVTYAMSTGHNMIVSSFGSTLRVRYDRSRIATLRPDGQGGFISRDGSVALQFELDASGEPDLVRVTMPTTWM